MTCKICENKALPYISAQDYIIDHLRDNQNWNLISFNESPHTSQSFEHEELESENVISLHTSDTMLFLTHISENKRAVIPIIGVIIVLAPSHIINI